MEEWLGKAEEGMVTSLRKIMRQALLDVDTMSRNDWLVAHPNQITLTVEQLVWARDIHEILDNPEKTNRERLQSLKNFEEKSFEANSCSLNDFFYKIAAKILFTTYEGLYF